MNDDIMRVDGKYVGTGQLEQRWECEVCGGTACSWRYKNHALNGKENFERYARFGYPDGEPTESYFNCHPDAKIKIVDVEIQVWQHGWTAVKCCGMWMRCYNFTNTCDCGADYNMSGQQLASRSQWGEETGESVDDILAANYAYHDDAP